MTTTDPQATVLGLDTFAALGLAARVERLSDSRRESDRQGLGLDQIWAAWWRGGFYRLQAKGELGAEVDLAGSGRSFRTAGELILAWIDMVEHDAGTVQ